MLMGKGNAEVNLVVGDGDEAGGGAEDEYECENGYEYEYECGGWWVGTVGAVEVPEGADKPSGITTGQEPAQGDDQDKLEGEIAEDEQWNLESGYPSYEDEEADAPLPEPPQHPLGSLTRSPHLTGADRPRSRMRPRVTSDQQWEEARHSAWLRQLLSDSQVMRMKTRSGMGGLLNQEDG
jgi:hypothetical protein